MNISSGHIFERLQTFTLISCVCVLTSCSSSREHSDLINDDPFIGDEFQPPSKLPIKVNTSPQMQRLPNLAAQSLVLFNQNSEASRDLANYYREKRGIPEEQSCGVFLETGQYTSMPHALGARRQILQNCLCPLIPENQRPTNCGPSTVAEIAEKTNITHLVILKGIPLRFHTAGWEDSNFLYGYTSADDEEPIYDWYLAYSLFREDLASSQYDGEPFEASAYAAMWASAHSRPRHLLPSLDKVLAYSRVEAVTYESTKRLIDRTIEAEKDPRHFTAFLGHESWQGPHKAYKHNQYRLLTSTLTPANYYEQCVTTNWAPPMQWTGENTDCPVAWEIGGYVLGENPEQFPTAKNIGLYFNEAYLENTQLSFDGFDNMLSFRVGEQNCSALCEELEDEDAVARCRDQSTDFFREINTQCVGVANGAVGKQKRSWTTQFMGFFPAGWRTDEPGAIEKTAPEHLQGDGVQSLRFNDTNFLRFRSIEEGQTQICQNDKGEQIFCVAPLTIDLQSRLSFELRPIERVRLRFYYRFRENISPSTFRARLRLLNEAGPPISSTHEIDLLTAEQNQWTPVEFIFEVPEDFGSIRQVLIHFIARKEDNLEGIFDLDGVSLEIIDEGRSEHLLEATIGSFAAPQQSVSAGQYAADAIDRLGFTAWLGSANHHITGGSAFSNTNSVFEHLFRGRTLGEAVVANATSVASGFAFGDPVHRKFAAFISHSDPDQSLGPQFDSSYFQPSDLDDGNSAFLIDAFIGDRSQDDFITWKVERCFTTSANFCTSHEWDLIAYGEGAVYEQPAFHISDLIKSNNTCHRMLLRLVVTHTLTGLTRTDLQPVQYYVSDEPPVNQAPELTAAGHLLGDFNLDNIINEEDLELLQENFGSADPLYDLNGDGLINYSDLTILLSLIGTALIFPPECNLF